MGMEYEGLKACGRGGAVDEVFHEELWRLKGLEKKGPGHPWGAPEAGQL